MFEFKKEELSIEEFNGGRFVKVKCKLLQDGVEIQDIYIAEDRIWSHSHLTSVKIAEARIDIFPQDYLLLLENLEDSELTRINIEIGRNPLDILELNIKVNQEEEYLVKITMIFDLNKWKKNFSYEEYINEFSNILGDRDVFYLESVNNDLQITHDESDYGNEIVAFTFHNFTNNSIHENLFEYLDFLKNLHLETIKNVEKSLSKELISLAFNFPTEIKTSCEQYLLYFAQFLQDLGINVTSNLKEEAGKVLFSVTPADDIEALDKIREALAVYLNLPSSPVLYNDSFQSMQLKQQVENLQHSQRMKEMEMRSAQYALRLAQQNIENQDKIITRQNSFIDNQNKIIEKITSKSVMIDSLENKEELEKFCEGFEVGKSEFLIKHFGLHLNPATVLKNVGKKILGKEEERISILDSDEETDKNN